jgi:hypothetical protein
MASYAQVQDLPTVQILTARATEDPEQVEADALADAAGQAAVEALGCMVTILQSAEDYRAKVEANARAIKRAAEPPFS